MKPVLVPVAHHPGRHCASTALCNMVNFHGLQLSEAMCFGIGSGLGIWYLSYPGMDPSRFIHVRSADIELQFFTRIGYPFSWQHYKDPMDAQHALCVSASRGRPSIVQTDIFHLPYYNSKTHFPGHDITVWGYDPSYEVFLTTDTERVELLHVPFGNMREAMYAQNGFFIMEGNQFSPEILHMPEDMADVIRSAIVHNSSVIHSEGYDFQGIRGLEKWIKEIPSWPDLPDWQWAARFSYQVIERRGTGGGGFRTMYADFLKEGALFVPEIARRGLPEMMYEISRAWTGLALALKVTSERTDPDFSDVYGSLVLVQRLESAYHREAKILS